jgi:hypothetical protein
MLDLVQCGLRIVVYIRFGSFKELRKSNRDLTNYGCTKIKMWIHWQNINFINLFHFFFLLYVLCLFFLFSPSANTRDKHVKHPQFAIVRDPILDSIKI